ncbi:MAG: ABC transporter substrate-binding protein [Patescibacteria group bacterium]
MNLQSALLRLTRFGQSKIISNNYRTIALIFLLIIVSFGIRFAAPYYLEEVPSHGGSFTEGMVGYPRFVNPVLALSQTDKDLTRLIYSGLFRYNSEKMVVPDLAQSYEVNDDATEYTILLRADNAFHNGSAVTTEDVAYTLSLIRDPLIKSPLFPRFQGVSWIIEDARTIRFNLSTPDPNFLDTLTVGILSKDQWASISLEEFPFALANINPIGSGPYAIRKINRDSNQRIQSYILKSSTNYHTLPYINEIEIIFYPNQDAVLAAFESDLIDNLANISPQELLRLDRALTSKNIQSFPLRRSFNIFINMQDNPLLAELEIRKIIRQSINKKAIIDGVLLSRADIATGPLPLNHPDYLPTTDNQNRDTYTSEKIEKVFTKLGYTKNDDGFYQNASSSLLTLSLHTPESAELEAVAKMVAQDLAKIGIKVEVIATPSNQIINDVVRTRNFDLLLFGQLVNDANSLYSFWHSSQIGDPGINIAGFANSTVDAILERLIDPSLDQKQRTTDNHHLQEIIRDEVAAIFVYHPHFIYATKGKIKNSTIDNLDFAWDRFNSVTNWYIHTESLLPWFIP